MTGNKPIITHGVDVSSCINYAYNICTATRDNYGDSLYFCDKSEMKDCYFKQLARKTQECEELKNNNDILKEHSRYYKNESKRYKKEIGKLKAENEKLKKKKEENETFYLKKYANKDSECLELDHKLKQAEEKLKRIREKVQAYINDEADLTPEQVIQIIDEVK